MAKDNLTAVLYGVEDLRLEQRPIPEIEDHEVLVEMDCVGVCGTDIHYFVHGSVGDVVVDRPWVIGHESSGVIAKIGKNINDLKVGDRVAIEPGAGCRVCEFCKKGRYNLCKNLVYCATPPIHGGNLTRFYKHLPDICFKLPSHVTMEEGGLLEPLACGVHACRRANVELGSEVLILGSGPIGLVTLATAKAMGASKIIITDMVQSRLDIAKSLGATETLLITKEMTEEEQVKLIHRKLGSEPDRVIDCFGGEPTVRLGILACRPGGIVAVMGMAHGEAKIPLINALVKEIDIRGVFRYSNDYPAALAMVASGAIDIKRLVTHHFDITETKKAFDTARYGHGGAIKVMIHCQPRNTNNKIPFKP